MITTPPAIAYYFAVTDRFIMKCVSVINNIQKKVSGGLDFLGFFFYIIKDRRCSASQKIIHKVYILAM